MLSRPIVLVLMLFLLVAMSHFEQQLITEAEAKQIVSRRKHYISDKEEATKEKIILSQEKNIHQLTELVRSLQQQLLHCRGINNTIHSNPNPLTEDVNGSETQQILET